MQLPGRGGENHLDTVFSQIDHDAFVVYADLVERLPTYALRPGRHGRISVDHESTCSPPWLASSASTPCASTTRATTR